MSDRQKQQNPDGQREDILQEFFNEVAEAKSEALWNAYQAELEAGTAPEMPEELDAKCRELIRTSKKKGIMIQFRKFICNGLRSVAVVALVLIVLTSALVMTVDAIKVPVMNFIVDESGKYSSVIFGVESPQKESGSLLDEVINVRLPTGYNIESASELPNGTLRCRFADSGSAIIQVTIIPEKMMLAVDTEDAEQISTTVYDWPANYLRKNGHRVLWFNSNTNHAYDVYASDLSENEFWKYVYRLAE